MPYFPTGTLMDALMGMRSNPNQIVGNNSPMSPMSQTPRVNPYMRTPEQVQTIDQSTRQYTQPMEPLPEVTQHGQGKEHGFMARLKDALKGQILMGPFGGIAAAISPQMAHNAQYNLLTKPRAMADRQFQSEQQTAGLNRMRDVEQMTGMIPNTGGLPSARQQQHEGTLRSLYERMDQNNRQFDERMSQKDQDQSRLMQALGLRGEQVATSQQRARDLTAAGIRKDLRYGFQSGQIPNTAANRQYAADNGVIVGEEFDPSKHVFVTDDFGVYRQVDIPKSGAPTKVKELGKLGKTYHPPSGSSPGDPRYEQWIETTADAQTLREIRRAPQEPDDDEDRTARMLPNLKDKNGKPLYRTKDQWQEDHKVWEAEKAAKKQEVINRLRASVPNRRASGGTSNPLRTP